MAPKISSPNVLKKDGERTGCHTKVTNVSQLRDCNWGDYNVVTSFLENGSSNFIHVSR